MLKYLYFFLGEIRITVFRIIDIIDLLNSFHAYPVSIILKGITYLIDLAGA